MCGIQSQVSVIQQKRAGQAPFKYPFQLKRRINNIYSRAAKIND